MLNLGFRIKLSKGVSSGIQSLLFLFCFCSVQSQVLPQTKDSYFDQATVTLDSAISWINVKRFEADTVFAAASTQIIQRAKKEKEYNKLGKIHAYVSNWYYLNSAVYNPDSIIFHQEKSIEFYEKAENFDTVYQGYVWISPDYMNNGEPDKAEESILKAVHYFEKTNNEEWLAQAYSQIASLYLYTKEPEKVIEYSALSYPILLKKGEFLVACSLLQHSSAAYLMLKDYQKAQSYIDQSIQLGLENEFVQKKDILIVAYQTKGDIYSEQSNHAQALFYYNKAWQDNISLEGKENADFYRYNIGRELFLQQKYEEALPHLIAGIKGKENSEIEKAPEPYLTLSKCYEMLGDYKNAILFRDKAAHSEVEIFQDKIDHLKSEMIVKYETEKKDEAISAQEILLTQKSKVQNLIIGVAALLFTLLFLLLYFFRKNKKATQVISQKNSENELLLKEIHHRVKNNLEMVKGLLALQSSKLEDSATKDAMIASQNRVQSMGIIHQKLYQGKNLGSVEMKDYFTNLGEGVLDSFDKEDRIKIECAMENLDLDVDTAVPIGLIVNELLTNALKYAFPKDEKGTIRINLSKPKKGILALKFTDNGVGKEANVAPKGTGFGTQLIQLLTQQLNGEMKESSGLGTSYVFEFKIDSAA